MTARALTLAAIVALAGVASAEQARGVRPASPAPRPTPQAPGAATQSAEPGTKNPEPGTLNPEPSTVRVGFLSPNGKHSVVTLPMETYVARVLAGEAARDSQPAALEALAIAIRTFALANRGRHRADQPVRQRACCQNWW